MERLTTNLCKDNNLDWKAAIFQKLLSLRERRLHRAIPG